MDKEFKTTFIPKKKLSTEKEKVVQTSKSNSIISLLAGLLFVTAIVSVIGVYLYKLNIARIVKSYNDSINLAEKAFEPAAILELKKLDIRLRAATELLDKHVAISDFFDSLGETTLPDVAFNDFNFTFNEDNSEVSMVGEARGFLPIAQQSDLFEKNQYIQNHIFSDFQLTETGIVSFNLSFTLNKDLLLYGRVIRNSQTDTDIDGGVVIPHQENSLLPKGENVDFTNYINN